MNGRALGHVDDRREPADLSPEAGTLEKLVEAKADGVAALDRVRYRIGRESRLSAGYLGIGSVALGAAVLVRGLVGFAWASPAEPWGWLSAAGWALVVTTYTVVVCVAFSNRGVLPVPAFRAALAVGATAIALDTVASLAARGAGPQYPTVEIGLGALVLACVSFRPIRELIRVLWGLGILTAVGLLVSWLVLPASIGVGVSNLLLGVTPPAIALALVSVFDHHVRRELDRTVAESTIEASAAGPGILEVAALARLDARAERLLDEVGSASEGTTTDAGALTPEVASAAAVIGDRLRAALLADYELTWLQRAVADSASLFPAVTVRDPDGLAAELDSVRRRALLAVVWLLAAETGSGRHRVELAFVARPPIGSYPAHPARAASTLVITLAETKLRSIDPSVWPMLDRLGPRVVEARSARILVEIDQQNSDAGEPAVAP